MSDITRKSRLNGATIVLHDRRHGPCILELNIWWRGLSWELECCSHGFTCDYETKTEALAYMAHSDEWCIGCIEGWEIDDEVSP